MAQQARSVLKTKFETGDRPSQDDFTNLIDSQFNITDDTVDDIADGTTYVRYSATEKTKLSGIEMGAEVNPDASEVKTLYESNSNTNAFTDSEKTSIEGLTARVSMYAGIANFSASPTLSTIGSSLSGTVTISNTGTGVYRLTSTDLDFTTGRTIVSVSGNDVAFIKVTMVDAEKIDFTIYNSSASETDGLITAAFIKIEVY